MSLVATIRETDILNILIKFPRDINGIAELWHGEQFGTSSQYKPKMGKPKVTLLDILNIFKIYGEIEIF